MNLEAFQLLDNETFDNSIIKRDFPKVCHQQRTNLNDPDQNIEFISGENNNYHQICNSYLEFDITVRREDNANFTDVSLIGMTNNAFAFCSKKLHYLLPQEETLSIINSMARYQLLCVL